ncbi:MAG TPA: RHS repeat-associated core domain-containing protein [Dehalococcoidia bacterium]|nr:RHS repeat-associated core domain-containing protein [Dehalococcoidia bacterium]
MTAAAAAALACFSPRRTEGRTPSRRNSHQAPGRFWGRPRVSRYCRARYYHPGLQRFLSEDPIGFAGGDVNLYAYVSNNPTNYVDPLGLDGAKDACSYAGVDCDSSPPLGGRKDRSAWRRQSGDLPLGADIGYAGYAGPGKIDPVKLVRVLWDIFSAIMEALNPAERRQPPEPPQEVEPAEKDPAKQKERKDRGGERGGPRPPRGGKRR